MTPSSRLLTTGVAGLLLALAAAVPAAASSRVPATAVSGGAAASGPGGAAVSGSGGAAVSGSGGAAVSGSGGAARDGGAAAGGVARSGSAALTRGADLGGGAASGGGASAAARLGGVAAPGGDAASGGAAAVTGAVEARRVGRVATPRLRWRTCYVWAQCATAQLPRDYDAPRGVQTKVALLRVPATDRKHRLGSLFVNPGGPGASATTFALSAPMVLSQSLLARFDIVGMDPRGVGASSNVACFRSPGRQAAALKGMNVPFPVGDRQTAAYVAAVRKFATACSTTGRPLTAAMSTAEVARDLEVMRRAVGDRKLSYLGFSYGTALGQYYAAMFPDRFRAIAVDGVINPASWIGTPGDRTIQDVRLGSATGAERALHRILTLCASAGPARCPFAAGDPVARFAALSARLKQGPITINSIPTSYADVATELLAALYGDDAPTRVTTLLTDLWRHTPAGSAASSLPGAAASGWITPGVASSPVPAPSPGAVSAGAASLSAAAGGAASASAAAGGAVSGSVAAGGAVSASVSGSVASGAAASGAAASGGAASGGAASRRAYDNSLDAYAAVMCTDGHHPAKLAAWPALVAEAEAQAPTFGAAWAWASAPCARDVWTVRDEDAYKGPFSRRTTAPLLVVGSFWDPATNYDEAVGASRVLANARLLSSDNFGHTAYGTSDCATNAVDRYLLTVALPAAGKTCHAPPPFTSTTTAAAASPAPDAAHATPASLLPCALAAKLVSPLALVRTAAITAQPACAPVVVPHAAVAEALDLSTAAKEQIAAAGLPAAGTVKQRPPVSRRPW